VPSKGETKEDRAVRVAWVLNVADEGGAGCREWPWSKSPKGYGALYWGGRVRRVGHIVLTLTGRPRPSADHQQLHSCDNPACAAPWHLRWGTNLENRRESVERGRHFTKLTESQVRNIYASSDTQRSLAAQHGVTQRVIWQIKRGKTWTRVTGHAA
jgi:hypothetical protein